MTLTPEQLAAVLPRCSAGLDGGDWTDDDDRLAWATKVLPWLEEAIGTPEPLPPEVAPDGVNEARIEMVHDLHRAVHGGTWARPEPPVVVWRGLLRQVELWRSGFTDRLSALVRHESDETGREVAQPLLKPSRATQGPIRTYAAVIPYGPIRLTGSNDWPAPDGQLADNAVCPTCPILTDTITPDELLAQDKIDAVHDACQTLDDDRRRYGPRHGDRWTVRNGRAAVVASNDWPAPRKGTHESECGVEDSPGCLPHGNPWHIDCPGGFDEYNAGIHYWSRTPDTEDAK